MALLPPTLDGERDGGIHQRARVCGCERTSASRSRTCDQPATGANDLPAPSHSWSLCGASRWRSAAARRPGAAGARRRAVCRRRQPRAPRPRSAPAPIEPPTHSRPYPHPRSQSPRPVHRPVASLRLPCVGSTGAQGPQVDDADGGNTTKRAKRAKKRAKRAKNSIPTLGRLGLGVASIAVCVLVLDSER